MIGSSHFQNDAQEFIRKSLSSPLYVVGRFYLLFSHRLVNLIRLVILLLNLSLNAFQTQANIFWKPLMLLLRLTKRKESTCLYKISMMSKSS
ncbi:hypothetical protein Goshw_017704 [Gossypium schwendimanii]|uniref:Uncharacterized protein n=1 Tax=Gossypium schwendimanii TaxID=34291 RepID=A0A7J9NGA9_GOSSC|nr:hypothetical protein [Gossypium schwendimanii]